MAVEKGVFAGQVRAANGRGRFRVQTQGVADIIEIELRNMNAISGELNQCQNRRAHLYPDLKLTSPIKELLRVWRNTTEQNNKECAHKISLVYNPKNETFYLYYCAVGSKGRGIGLITSKPLPPLALTDKTGTVPNEPAIDQALPRSAAVHAP